MAEAKTRPATELGTQTLSCVNPLTGEEIGRVPIMGPANLRSLVAACRTDQAIWSRRSLRERMRALKRLRLSVTEKAEDIAALVRAETGKALGEALGGEVLVTCDHLAYLSKVAHLAIASRSAGTGFFPHRKARVDYEPYGVVGAITPWNYPFTLSMGVAATAIIGGNGVVLKPSEYTQLTGKRVAELVAEATGLGNLVAVATGDGSTGAALVAAGVDKVAFTGSVATGKAVMRAASESLTPVVLELGGKDAMIVCADADIGRAASGAVWAAFYGCGQVCQSVERVYVVESAYDEFVQAALAEARRVRTSDEPEATIGSLIAPFQVQKVEGQLADAKERGARILLGGRALDMPGHFFEPTVVVDVDHTMDLMRHETFGPVLPIMRVADEDEAVRLANATEYGLDASVWSRNRRKARSIAERLDVGTVLINDHLINYAMAELPFGGTKHSGFGRVHGLEGLREFVRPKSWVEDRHSFKREMHWFDEDGSGGEMARGLITMRHGRGVWPRLRAAVKLLSRLGR